MTTGSFICTARRLAFGLALFGMTALLCKAENMDAARIRQIAAMLPARPAGLGQPIVNRTAWNNARTQHPELEGSITNALRLAAQSMGEARDDLYLEFSQNGNRERWQKAEFPRRRRIQIFTLAECLENKGRFLAPLENTITALCAEKTWVWSAHDPHLQNFRGQTVEIDLGAAELGLDMATAAWLLGDRLSPATRKLIGENLERRIFGPYRDAVHGVRKEFWWMHGNNNWNAVCQASITGAALAAIGPAEDRAWFIACAENRIGSYLAGGFTPDGYCVEGLDYWNYGFGNFLLLSENIRQATGGKMDFLTDLPAAAQPALFGFRSEILNGVYLAVADTDPAAQPSDAWMNYLRRRLGMDTAPWGRPKLRGGLCEEAAIAFLPDTLPVLHLSNDLADLPWRSWFSESDLLVCRPGPAAPIPFAVAIKGGNNGVNHGHNDLGSFTVVFGKTMVLCDPGEEVYTARTFSSHRYDSKVLSSFGHSAPVVAGQLQLAGSKARTVVVAKDFTPDTDTLTFDLRAAYPVADIEKLERTFVYRRGSQASLEVRDEVKYATPQEFESALITWGQYRRLGGNELEISDGGAAVRVVIDTQGRAFKVKQETINEDVMTKRKPVRIGIALEEKVPGAVVTLRITPVTR
jgi:hypothetical protein